MRSTPGKEFAALQTCSRLSWTPCTQVNLRGAGAKAPETSGMCVAGCYKALRRRLHSDRGGDWTMSRKTIGSSVSSRIRRLGGGGLRRPPLGGGGSACVRACACLHRCSL